MRSSPEKKVVGRPRLSGLSASCSFEVTTAGSSIIGSIREGKEVA